MKTNKTKTSIKTEQKTAKQVVKKELEASITNKFLEALKSLGHDADKFSKDIKKTSKELAKKLARKYNEVKVAVEEQKDSKSNATKIKRIKRPIAISTKKAVSPVKKAVLLKPKAAPLKPKAIPLKPKAVKKSTPKVVKPIVSKSTATAAKKTIKSPVKKAATTKPVAVKSAKSPAKKIVAKKPVVNKVKATVAPVAKKARKNTKTT